MRTYYCFQLGLTTYPAGEVIASTRKPVDMRGVRKIRAASTEEARRQYLEEFKRDCQDALRQEEQR